MSPEFTHDDIYLYSLCPDTIRLVIFGCLATDLTKKRVITALRDEYYHKPEIYQATQGNGFALELQKYDVSLCESCGGAGLARRYR